MSIEEATLAFYHRIVAGAWPESWLQPSPQILAGINWEHLQKYLAGCGFAGALVRPEILDEFSRWAPAPFVETLRRRATGDALRELSHRDTLERLHAALVVDGIRGILLKGAAIYLQEQSRGIMPARVPGDIDLLIESPEAAACFRTRLIQQGFAGDIAAPRTAPHHLAPVIWRSSAVEIHTAPMPEFWGLPADTMATQAQPLGNWPQFHTLNHEHMALHEVVHSTSHLWSFGLKLPFDLLRIQRLEAGAIDWWQVVRMAEQMPCPMAFWAPLAALQKNLSPDVLPFHAELLNGAPGGTGLTRVARRASQRMFSATDDAEAINPFQKNAIFLSLFEGRQRLKYLRDLVGPEAAEARRSAFKSQGKQSWRHLPAQLIEALRELSRRSR